jgi:hypothetical protein
MPGTTIPKPIFRSSHGLICNDEIYVINACSINEPSEQHPKESYQDLDYGSLYTVRPLSQQVMASDNEDNYYFDPSDEYIVRVLRKEHVDKQAYGKAFHLSCDSNKEGSTSKYTRNSYIDTMLCNLSEDKLFGCKLEFKSLDYALVQDCKIQTSGYDFPANRYILTQTEMYSLIVTHVQRQDMDTLTTKYT